MDKILPSNSADIKPLKERLISAIEQERKSGCKLGQIMESASEFKDACRRVIEVGEENISSSSLGRTGTTLPLLENAYRDWKSVNRCFSETLRLAFVGSIPKENLLLDDIHANLRITVGEPLSSIYTRTRTMWNKHLENCPWDAFVEASGEHTDHEAFNKSIEALNHGDDLDVEDAIEDLTGSLRYLFITGIEDDQMVSSMLASGLWKRPEIIVINDYWQGNRDKRILDLLRKRGAQRFAGSFAKVQDIFEGGKAGGLNNDATSSPELIIRTLQKSSPKEQDKMLRCLMLHPDNGIRRYAAANIDLGGFWKVVTPQAVPCATILSQLEQVAGSSRFDESLRKIFFNAVYRRLLNLTSRSELIYARGIARILMQLDFLMADTYFEKLIVMLDYLEAKEKFYGIKDSLLDDYIKKFREAKKSIGPMEIDPPDFQAIPAVVLRKLARDGHFWYELAMHPIFKVARETIPHINTADRGYRIATNPNVNQEVLRVVGKRRSLFISHRSKLALLSNLRTPPAVSMEYIPDLSKTDIESLLRRSSIHPELRFHLMKKYKP